jgi:hypothetical protein
MFQSAAGVPPAAAMSPKVDMAAGKIMLAGRYPASSKSNTSTHAKHDYLVYWVAV